MISLFSYIGILILQTKSIKSKNLQNQYLYIQAKNHMDFFEDYVENLDLTTINKIEIQDNTFNIYANILFENNQYKIDMYVKAKDYNISIYKNVVK